MGRGLREVAIAEDYPTLDFLLDLCVEGEKLETNNNMTDQSLDSDADKKTLLLILHFICTSYRDKTLLSPHQVSPKNCYQATK